MPENKTVLVHLADLYKSKGDMRMANNYYLHALEVDSKVIYSNTHHSLLITTKGCDFIV